MLKENYQLTRQNATRTATNRPVLRRDLTRDGVGLSSHITQQHLRETFRPSRQSYTVTDNDAIKVNDTLPSAIRVMIVDKQVIVHAGLRSLLAGAGEIVIGGAATSGADAIQLAARLQPDVILIDPMTLEIGWIEIIQCLHRAHPACQIIVLTTVSEECWVQATLQAGAVGYLLKDVLKPELLRAIRAAARGEPTLHPAAQRFLMRQPTRSPFQDLTERELDVLRLIGQGCSNRAIAMTLCLTEGTVKGYVSTILAKLQVSDRTQAALYAVKHELLKKPIIST